MPVFRPTTPDDLAAIQTLLGAVWNNDEGAIAYHGGGRVPGVVVEEGRLVGYASVRRGTLHPRHSYVGVHIHPGERGRGIGKALWDVVTASVDGSLKTATSADQPGAVRFLERRGLRVSVETHQPTLDPVTLDTADVERWAQAARALGYDLFPMTALSGPEVRADLARLHLEVYAHTHEHDPPVGRSLEDAEADFLGDDLHPGWLWVAARGSRLVGVASVRTTGDPERGELAWFGVGAEHAAGGAALTLALTGRAVQAAGTDGVRAVVGELDSADPNALHLLGTLPWQPGRVWLTLTSAAGGGRNSA